MTPNEIAIAQQQFLQNIFWIMAGIGTVLGAVYLVIQIFRSSRRNPPIESEFASKQELTVLEQRCQRNEERVSTKLDELSKQLQIMYEKIERSDEARTSGIHNRMNGIAENVAGLKGALDEHMKRESKGHDQ